VRRHWRSSGIKRNGQTFVFVDDRFECSLQEFFFPNVFGGRSLFDSDLVCFVSGNF
jgi:hypothetical protein